MRKYLLGVVILLMVLAPVLISQIRRGRIVEITPQSHPATTTNGLDYDFVELQGSQDCWFYYGQDQECDLKFLRFPAYTGTAPLREVRLQLRWHISWVGKYENLHPTHFWNDPTNEIGNPGTLNPLNGLPWGFNWYTWAWATTEGGNMLALSQLPSITIDDCFYGYIAPFDGTLDFQGDSGGIDFTEWSVCLQPNYWTEAVCIIQHPFYLQTFTDPDGVVELTFKSGAFPQIEHPWGNSGMAYEFNSYWDISLDKIQYVTY